MYVMFSWHSTSTKMEKVDKTLWKKMEKVDKTLWKKMDSE